MMNGKSMLRNSLVGALGSATGALFLWLALRNIDLQELGRATRALDGATMAFAGALYWVAISLRVLRWQVLLRELGPAPISRVAESLVVGYAVNNVLPARLGEVARAAYAKRRLGIGRARVFGSIVVERLLDLCAILTCLVAGLVARRVMDTAARLPTFEIVALNAGAVIGVAALGIVAFRSGDLGLRRIPGPVLAVLSDLRAGLQSLNRRSAVLVTVLTIGVWFFEVAALMQAFLAADVPFGAAQGLLVMGAASLSTLVPTAPGYLGTYQLVFVIAMHAFGLPASTGVVVSFAIQAALFGSVTLAGGLIVALRSMRRLSRSGAWRSSPG